jgi:glucosamine 6-phosphate synthetase-like amidotransferase/phosphosugar isomerase protein
MCRIVAYFGGAGNNLTRVLAGMSAIIYRAPDSTGVGVFGDDGEPIRTRKSIGSIKARFPTRNLMSWLK